MSESERFINWLRAVNPEGNLYLLAKAADGGPVLQRFYSPARGVAPLLREIEKLRGSHHVWVAPASFAKQNATKGSVLPTNLAWIDHDGPNADPNTWTPKPHVAWYTSTGRAQAIWVLDRVQTIEQTETLNAELAKRFGADPSGKDVVQVLRVPGTLNLKHDPPEEVRLLWFRDEDPPYSPYDVVRQLPDAPSGATGDTEEPIPVSGGYEEALRVLVRYGVAGKGALEALEEPQRDRSAALWRLEKSLAEAGATERDIFTVVSASVNNKFDSEHLWADVKRAKKDTPEKTSWSSHHLSEIVNVDTTVRWIVENLLYHDAVGMIAGEPGSRKSWSALQLAAAVAYPPAGEVFSVPVNVHGPVLYFFLDDRRERRLTSRLYNICRYYGMKKKDELAALPFHFVNEGFDFNDRGWDVQLMKEFERIRERNGAFPVLTVFDTLHRSGFSPKDYGANAQPFLNRITDIARVHEIAFLLVHHNAKNSGESNGRKRNVRNAPWGNTFLGASVDPTWETRIADEPKDESERAKRDPNRDYITIDIAHKEGPAPPQLFVSYGRNVDVFDPEIEELTTSMQIVDLLERHADALPFTASEIARQLGASVPTTIKKLKRLVESGKVTMTDRKGGGYNVGLPNTQATLKEEKTEGLDF